MTANSRVGYRRLPGGKSGLLRRDTLWLGPDHLLHVRSSRFSEDYRRFYFTDIQALVVQHRPVGNRLAVDWVAIGVGVAALTALFLAHHAAWGTLFAVVVAAYIWYVLRREDCEAWVQTAVGTAELPPLCRIRSANRALALIDEQVREAQPAIPVAELSRALDTPPPLPVTVEANPPPAPPPLPQAVDSSRVPSPIYVVAFVLLLIVGVLKMFAALSASSALNVVWVSAASYFAFPVLVILPLIRDGTRNIRGSRLGAVLISMVTTGTIGMNAINWASSEANRKMQTAEVRKVYETLENGAPLRIGLAVILLALAIWGLLAFLTAPGPADRRSDGPLTLFGPEGS